MTYTRRLLRVVQTVPVRVYQTEDHFVIAVPMPGLEPPDISVTISVNQVTLRGVERGPGQHEREVLVDEWTVGPYYREIALPQPVNGPLTNATYGNGVLVLSLPKLRKGQRRPRTTFQLETLEATHGEHVGHTGSAMQPTTTLAHRRMRAAARRTPRRSPKGVPKTTKQERSETTGW